MDKKMFVGYVRELVREAVQEELDRVLPKKINEIMSAQRQPTLTEHSRPIKPTPSRAELAKILGLERVDSETLVASTRNMATELPPSVDPSNPDVQKTLSIINKDYSALMKKLV
jgi:hypothetical protein